MFGKKKRVIIDREGNTIELQPKPGILSKLNKKNDKNTALEKQVMREVGGETKKPTKFRLFIENIGAKHKNLEIALRAQGIKESLYDFIKKMLIAAIMLSLILAISMFVVFAKRGVEMPLAALLSGAMGIGIFYMFFNGFLNFPTQKGRKNAKLIERDILFAARDMIISLRSGMPLFNALTAVSTGYGEASREFGKIISKAQLGVPLVEAIDQTIEESKSDSFKRLMLQASVSLKSGADVVSSMQSIIDELAQERNIELRRYGQKLNALAMFYMLFGVIFPSMGVAVGIILTTFISLFTINFALLIGVLVFILFIQIIFLNIMRSSRPTFAM